MKTLLAFLLSAFCLHANSQVIVHETDLNKEVEIFEVYAFKKPFNTKECYFADFGQKDFKLHFYDHKRQAIYTADGRKFEKGEWLNLLKYLRSQGWEKTDERKEKLGNNEGRVITFEKVSESKPDTEKAK